MPQARIFNDNVHPHRENFKGAVIEIAAGGYVDMDHDEALQFEGQFFPMIKNAGGQQDSKSFKRLRVEALGSVAPAVVPLVCHATGKVAANAAELKRLNEENEHSLHEDAKETVAELKEKDAEIAALRAELAAATAIPPKNKGGRPRKDASL